MYKFYYSPKNNLEGYVEHSLLGFNTSQYQDVWGYAEQDPSMCYYRGYKEPYNANETFGHSVDYWHILFARLAFVVIFEHIIFVVTRIFQYIIPDKPKEIQIQTQLEQLAEKEEALGHTNMPYKNFTHENFVEILGNI